MEKQEHHLDGAFKKDAAPEGVAIVGPARQPGLGFRLAMCRKPHRLPSGTNQPTIFVFLKHRITSRHDGRQADRGRSQDTRSLTPPPYLNYLPYSDHLLIWIICCSPINCL